MLIVLSGKSSGNTEGKENAMLTINVIAVLVALPGAALATIELIDRYKKPRR